LAGSFLEGILVTEVVEHR